MLIGVVSVPAEQAGYVGVFALTAIGCFWAIVRAQSLIDDRDTRVGLGALLAGSGLWAAFHVGRFVAHTPSVKLVFYVLGLIVGLSTVGAWLYFCSAYAGKSYHRRPLFRQLAVGTYLAIVAIKLTSPIHGLYFATETVSEPFRQLIITLGPLHWIVTGLAYVLSAIGFYMLFDLFEDSQYATRRLSALVGLAGLPVLFDLISYLQPGGLLPMNYEPIGVGLFALGVLYVTDRTFLAVRTFGREKLLNELEEAIILLDYNGNVRDANDSAVALFPQLADDTNTPIREAVPTLADTIPADEGHVVSLDGDGQTYYLVSTPELTSGETTIGHAVVLSDVTRVERQRRKLEHQRTQLDDVAEAVTHELRNTVNVIQGHLDLAQGHLDSRSDATTIERIETASAMTDRMTDVVADLTTLARYGRSVETTETVSLGTVVDRAWAAADTDGLELDCQALATVEGDPARLERLFANVFRFAAHNGARTVSVEQSGDTIVVTGDGDPLCDVDAEAAFGYGEAVPDAESGLLLPIVRTLAEAHDWSVTLDSDYADGLRLCVRC